MDNLRFYEQARSVPTRAQKKIVGGRLKGMTDINPMWRIKKLTEMYGPCGIGWWYEVLKKEIVYDELTNQKVAFLDILIYYKDPQSGEVSRGIPGTGGASFVEKETKGLYMSDECYKMALTDAISVAAKALGIGADIYFEKDTSKYAQNESGKQTTAAPKHAEPVKASRDAPAGVARKAKQGEPTLTDADIKRIADIMQSVFAGHPLQYKVFERLTGYKASKTAMKEIPRSELMRIISMLQLNEDQAVEEITKQEMIENESATA